MFRALFVMLVTGLLLAGISFAGRAAGRATPAPELSGGGTWLNTPGETPLTLATLRGKVVLVEFWTGGCINCLNTLPWVKQWYERHNRQGLVVVGVHSPEFRHEHAEAYVRDRVARLSIRYPIVMDNDFKIWRAYNNIYWPTMYLIDKTGKIRYKHIGEGNYNTTAQMIRTLLAEAAR